MTIDVHAEHRAWAFGALDELERFLRDPEFEGHLEAEAESIEKRRRELREGKYRVVFLGAYNVGKSSLINAFLGDEYLPTILEECTVKITQLVRAETMKTVLHCLEPPTDDELHALTRLIDACGIGARVLGGVDAPELAIMYAGKTPRELLKTLNALVTMNADEDFPQLRTLRQKFEEVTIHLPSDALAEDIALVDSPGVHTMTETSRRIAEGIIPHCHLVICLIDSQSAGNEHNREFIESIVRQHHRKVFFIINKSDQLNADEIDLRGRRGPAKDLYRTIHGIVEEPEVFFISSLYALTASQLDQGRITLEHLDANQKIKIPFGKQRELMQAEDPGRAVAAYLLEQSDIGAFRERLHEYLYQENKEGAILELVCRFIDDSAWKYARPLEIKLELAKDVPRLAELERDRARLQEELDAFEGKARQIERDYESMAQGGHVMGADYPGYKALVWDRFTDAVVERTVMGPLAHWLDDAEHMKLLRRGGSPALKQEMEKAIDAFAREATTDIEQRVMAVESRLIGRMREAGMAADGWTLESLSAKRPEVEGVSVKRNGSAFGYGFAGMLAGGAAGAFLATQVFLNAEIDASVRCIAGAAAGGVLGLLAGLFMRPKRSEQDVREDARRMVSERVEQALIRGPEQDARQGNGSIRDQLKEALEQRRKAFETLISKSSEQVRLEIRTRIGVIAEEEARLRQKQEEVIARLEPKISALASLGREANRIAEVNAPREKQARS